MWTFVNRSNKCEDVKVLHHSYDDDYYSDDVCTCSHTTQHTCVYEQLEGAHSELNCFNDHLSLSPELTAQKDFYTPDDIPNIQQCQHTKGKSLHKWVIIHTVCMTAENSHIILSGSTEHITEYWPCVPAMRAGVVGKSSGSLDLLPLTNSLFTVTSSGNSNFTGGLPVYHKSTTN